MTKNRKRAVPEDREERKQLPPIASVGKRYKSVRKNPAPSSSHLQPFRNSPPERTPPALSPPELNRRKILPSPADSASSDFNESEGTPRSSAILQELNKLAEKNNKFDLSSLEELGLSQNELETLDNSDKEEKMLLDDYWPT